MVEAGMGWMERAVDGGPARGTHPAAEATVLTITQHSSS